MRKLITAVTVAAFLASMVAPPALADGGRRHHGFRHGTTIQLGTHFKHRPFYRHRGWRHGGYWRPYRHRHWRPGHYRPWRHGRRHHWHGGYYHFHGDAAVVVGALAGGLVLGTLLSRPALPPPPPVLRSPTGAPLGGCLQTTGTGTWYGRPALFTGTMCYDPAGRAYVIPGSERFAGYLG